MFIAEVKNLSNQILHCSRIDTGKITIIPVPGMAKEYYVPFCRDNQGLINRSSFDMVFTFYDYEDKNIIRYIARKVYENNSGPLKASPKGN